MPKMKLTAAAVERLKPPAEGQVDYFDAAFPGLALRVTAKGVKSWTYFGRVDGKLRRVTLGRWPTLSLAKAREKAGEEADAMREGVDPTARKRAAKKAPNDRNSVAVVAAEWLKRDQAQNRSRAEVERVMLRDVLPAWEGRRVQSITRRDAIELIDGIADRGVVTLARRIHSHLHRMFRWSVARGIIDANPMSDLPKPGKEVKRDRVLNDAELRDVWRASNVLGWPFGPALQLLILTGARRDEIGALRWAEVDSGNAVIRLEGERTKNGQLHAVPLSERALELIETLPKITNDAGKTEFAFTTTGQTPVSGWSRTKILLDAKIEELRREETDIAGGEVEPMPAWRVHDFRRSVATGLQRLGFRLEVIEAVLGHVSGSRGGIVGVYQRHSFDEEKRAALDAWARHVEALLTGAPENVVELRSEAANAD